MREVKYTEITVFELLILSGISQYVSFGIYGVYGFWYVLITILFFINRKKIYKKIGVK